jgi:hypothetical protein
MSPPFFPLSFEKYFECCLSWNKQLCVSLMYYDMESSYDVLAYLYILTEGI